MLSPLPPPSLLGKLICVAAGSYWRRGKGMEKMSQQFKRCKGKSPK